MAFQDEERSYPKNGREEAEGTTDRVSARTEGEEMNHTGNK